MAAYLFNWEQGIALHAMQGNRASSLNEGEVSWFFSSCGGTWDMFSSYGGVAIKNFCLFNDVRTPLYFRWTPQSKLGLAEQYGRFWK